MLLTNAFSITMLGTHQEHEATSVAFKRIPLATAKQLLRTWEEPTPEFPEGRIVVESAVGHGDTARVLARLLEADEVPVRRVSVTIADKVVVAQYVGPRLPEGATALPEGAEVQWFLVHRQLDVRLSA